MSTDLVKVPNIHFYKSPSGGSNAVATGETDGHDEENASRTRLQ